MALQSHEDLFRIERAMLEHPDGMFHAAIAHVTGIPNATLSRYLRSMADCERIEQTPDGRWRPTLSWLSACLRAAAERVEEELRRNHAETLSP